MKKGLFICFEGPDASGKSTQARLLAEKLEGYGYKVLLTREPGDSSIGDDIRRMLLTDTKIKLDPLTELMLVTADRIQHIKEIIKPYLEQGYVVITDRYVASTIAYQGYGRQLDVKKIKQLCDWAVGGLYPDFTVYIEASIEKSVERMAARGEAADKLEAADRAFKERIRLGFQILSDRLPDSRKMIVPEHLTIEEAAKRIEERVSDLVLARM